MSAEEKKEGKSKLVKLGENAKAIREIWITAGVIGSSLLAAGYFLVPWRWHIAVAALPAFMLLAGIIYRYWRPGRALLFADKVYVYSGTGAVFALGYLLMTGTTIFMAVLSKDKLDYLFTPMIVGAWISAPCLLFYSFLTLDALAAQIGRQRTDLDGSQKSLGELEKKSIAHDAQIQTLIQNTQRLRDMIADLARRAGAQPEEFQQRSITDAVSDVFRLAQLPFDKMPTAKPKAGPDRSPRPTE